MRKTYWCLLFASILLSCKEKETHIPEEISSGSFTYIPSSHSGIQFINNLSNSELDNIIVNPGFYDGANVVIGDINNDSLPDIYFVSNQWENKLYLNKGDFDFKDITKDAGVAGLTEWEKHAWMSDLNEDGFLDIVVDSTAYINNGDLTFKTEKLHTSIVHKPIDINNDRLHDFFVAGVPNSMKINVTDNRYIDIAWYAGVAATDRSNDYLLADFDNDGLKDLFIANGIVGKKNDPDYLKADDSTKSAEERYSKMPSGSVSNFIFKQTANLQFKDITREWIGYTPSVSTGAAYADLDRDGDFDIVVNNTNAEAFLLRNDLSDDPQKSGLKIQSVPFIPKLLEPVNIVSFKHHENDFNTLDKQPLIPHTNATRGPKISVGDLNGDKLDDFFIGGGQGQPGAVFIQTKTGKLVQIPQPAFEVDKNYEETCSALFDIDGDKDLDLLIGSGGEEFLDKRLLLRLYINNGRGTFSRAEGLQRADIVNNLQKIYVNASCIAPADVDNDGDMDVFVGGGVVTGRYGFDSDSFILLNDGKGMLTGGSTSFDNRQHPVGMVQSAIWIDVDHDAFPELITAGEWMTPTLWKNDKGVLKETINTGLDSLFGWWNCLAKGDLDNDGDEDIVAGNFGLNTKFKVNNENLLKLYISDLDNNGTLEPIMSYNDIPVPTRDQLLKQVPALARKFPTYRSYSMARINQIVIGKTLFERHVNALASVVFINEGNGKFVKKELPYEAQWFPIFAIQVADVNGDGNNDILLGGNLGDKNGYGLLLMGKGDGSFETQPLAASGFVIDGEARDIQSLNFNKQQLFLVARNNDSLLVFKKK